jgi:hypothetical protein
MAGKVTFLAIDKWREYLEFTIGRKLREFFARNKGASIPPVTFYTPQQARAAGLPPTGWYDYSERRIGVVITDGTPYNLQQLKQQVEQARRQGLLVVGVGLDLSAVEASGMKVIFGDEDVVIARSDSGGKNSFAATLGQTITVAVTRGKRAACYSFPM